MQPSSRGWVQGYRLKTARWQRPTERSVHLLHFNPADDCSSWELSLLDKAGSQVDKGRAWRHELQRPLSTSIAFCRMNKLTSCHNISKWISGELDSKCIAPIRPVLCWMCQRPQQCDMNTDGETKKKKKERHHPVCWPFPKKNYCGYLNIRFPLHKNNPCSSTAVNHCKMGLGMRSDFTLHSSSEAPYLCLCN